MPYDPNTFENLYPYPNKEAIRAYFQKEVLMGNLAVPQDRITDSKLWIEEQTQSRYLAERIAYKSSENEAISAWQKHQETEHGFSNLPEILRQKIHGLVWEMGHSGGYGEMNNLYCDLVPLIIEVYELGKKLK